MKKIFFPILVLFLVVFIGIFFLKNKTVSNQPKTACSVYEMVYYYTDACAVCNKVKQEGTIEKIEALGVKVDKINANIGPVRHKFSSVPTFVIENQTMSGYKDLNQLKQLLGCP
jgi:hypothetical protein